MHSNIVMGGSLPVEHSYFMTLSPEALLALHIE
jgi:hypothetical protein